MRLRVQRTGLLGWMAVGLLAGCGGGEFQTVQGSDASTGTDSGDSSAVAKLGDPCTKAAELACAGHAQKLVLICDAKSMTWSALQSCSGQQLCDTRPGLYQGSCQDPVPACVGRKPGDKVCDGKKLVECGIDLVTSTDTQCPNVCKEGKCTGDCSPGTRQCQDKTPQICSVEGKWQLGAPCTYVCKEGSCTGECTVGDKQCVDNTPQSCVDGQWQSGTQCPNLCASGVCADSCVENATQCNGLAVQSCKGGKWEESTVCDFLCKGGVCEGVCFPGTLQCADKTPQSCDAMGQWQKGDVCAFVCQSGVCVGECVPGAKECSGLVPRLCTGEGKWNDDLACTYVCTSGECSGVCVPGEKKCDGATPQLCGGDGQWEGLAPCQFLCTAGECSGACTPGSTQCNGAVPQTCGSNGSWVDGVECPFVCEGGSCTGECKPNSKQCSGDFVQLCDSQGHWQTDTEACEYVCLDGVCAGECEPGTARCENNGVLTCTGGFWESAVSCPGAKPYCLNGVCLASTVAASCKDLPPSCGKDGVTDCCLPVEVPGGSFRRDNLANDNSSVSSFRLDAFEVTVGRFRTFLDAGKGTQASPPTAGAGAHSLITGSGWQAAWNGLLALDTAAFKSKITACAHHTWTENITTNGERLPINCLSWYDAFAFCAWDGGRLPTNAEWFYAAAGGAQQRVYPWEGSTIDSSYAVYGCFADGNPMCNAATDILSVASRSQKGDGYWGHTDLAGSMAEPVLDLYENPYSSNVCNDCALVTGINLSRTRRNGGWSQPAGQLTTTSRGALGPVAVDNRVGLRCARNPLVEN